MTNQTTTCPNCKGESKTDKIAAAAGRAVCEHCGTGWRIETDSIWADAEIISQYTRTDAIVDGVLVDANAGDCDEVSRQHFPNARVAMTSTAFALVEKAVAHPRWLNDFRGVWHDVCFMSRFRNADGLFKVIITGTGRVRNHILKRVDSHDVDGAPTVTFMLRGED